MKFLVFIQLPAALARFLTSRGVDCDYVLDIDLANAPDTEIWEHASRDDSVVIRKDEDFLYLANAPSAKGRLIWILVGELPHESASCRNGEHMAKDRGKFESGRPNHRGPLNQPQ